MNIDSKLLAATSAAIASLDFVAENARIAEIEADIGKMQAAMETANLRRDEISEMLRPYQGPRGGGEPYADHDGPAVADALLAELDPTEAASLSKTRDDLEHEREALKQAARDLSARIRAAHGEISEIRALAAGQVKEVVGPVIDAVFVNAQLAARQVVETFSAMKALASAANIVGPQMIAIENALTDGIMGQYRLLPWEEEVAVPALIVDALSGLGEKGPALRTRLLNTVPTR